MIPNPTVNNSRRRGTIVLKTVVSGDKYGSIVADKDSSTVRGVALTPLKTVVAIVVGGREVAYKYVAIL